MIPVHLFFVAFQYLAVLVNLPFSQIGAVASIAPDQTADLFGWRPLSVWLPCSGQCPPPPTPFCLLAL